MADGAMTLHCRRRTGGHSSGTSRGRCVTNVDENKVDKRLTIKRD